MIRRPSLRPGTIWQRARVMTGTTKKHIFFQLEKKNVLGTFLPLEKGRNTAILGPTDFFSDTRTCWVVREENKKTMESDSKNTKKFKKVIACGIELTKWSVQS